MKTKRAMFVGLMMFLAFMGGLLFWLTPLMVSGYAQEDERDLSPARTVLEATGLSAQKDAAAPALSLDTHGGFHGDGATLIVFESASELMAAISQAEGWRISPVTDEEYALLADSWFQSVPLVSPPPGTVFDAWFYRNEQPDDPFFEQLTQAYAPYLPKQCRDAEVMYSANWAMAFYDADTGLMCYYQLDT